MNNTKITAEGKKLLAKVYGDALELVGYPEYRAGACGQGEAAELEKKALDAAASLGLDVPTGVRDAPWYLKAQAVFDWLKGL